MKYNYNHVRKSCTIQNQKIDYDEYSINLVVNGLQHKIVVKPYDKTSKELLKTNIATSYIECREVLNSKTGEYVKRCFAVVDLGSTTIECALVVSESDIFILRLYEELNK